MSSRRAPLTSNHNAVNSPLRGSSAVLQKQKRSHALAQREDFYGQPPPTKKQMLDHGISRSVKSPTSHHQHDQAAANAARAQKKQQRSAAVYDNRTARVRSTVAQASAASQRHEAEAAEAVDVAHDAEVEQWRNHYLGLFPSFVFYFDSVPDDMRARLAKRVAYFGAREEMFFSNKVTHVVTTRAIPPVKRDAEQDDNTESHAQSGAHAQQAEQPATINPSLLDRSLDIKRKMFDSASNRKLAEDGAIRQLIQKPRNADVLVKARELNKKLWALDKLQRVLLYLMEPSAHKGQTGAGSAVTGSRHASQAPHQTQDLQRMLQNERIHGPSDREAAATSSLDRVFFKGPYIYLFDMDEKTKPLMVREYEKVADKTDGDWPQFRTVKDGRCPFVEEIEEAPRRVRDKEATREREQPQQQAKAAAPPPKMEPPKVVKIPGAIGGKLPLRETDGAGNRFKVPAAVNADAKRKATEPQAMTFEGGDIPHTFDFTKPHTFTARGMAPAFGIEPSASGFQAASATSAIRSQMISSNTGVAAAKAGTSKEVFGLQRKVLQVGSAVHALTGSHRQAPWQAASSRLQSRLKNSTLVREEGTESVAAAAATKPAARGVLSRSQTTGPTLAAAATIVEADGAGHRATTAADSQRRPKMVRAATMGAPAKKREAKAGFCENCQDKYDDLDKHMASRKHRQFAEDCRNWAEVDQLLRKIERRSRKANQWDTSRQIF